VNLPIVGNGEEDFVWAVEDIRFVGMSVVFKDESFEFELSSMTSKVGQDGDDDCVGYRKAIK
jgi:hypothetical protein